MSEDTRWSVPEVKAETYASRETVRKMTHDELRAHVLRIHHRACDRAADVYMSVPADPKRDADLLLMALCEEYISLRDGDAMISVSGGAAVPVQAKSQSKLDFLRDCYDAAKAGKQVEGEWRNITIVQFGEALFEESSSIASSHVAQVVAEWRARCTAIEKERELLRVEMEVKARALEQAFSTEERVLELEQKLRVAENERVERESLEATIDKYRKALERINEVRNGIVGTQGFHFSNHAYPLVAALNEAGFEGSEYERCRAKVGEEIRRWRAAERDVLFMELVRWIRGSAAHAEVQAFADRLEKGEIP